MIDYTEYECGCALYAPAGVPDLCPSHAVPAVEMLDQNIDMPEPHFFAHLADEQKLMIVCKLIDLISPEMKSAVLMQLAREQPQGHTEINVSSDEKFVRIDFGRTLAWFVLPKKHALVLGGLIMEHAGATLQQVPNPTQSKIPGDGQ